MFVCQLCDTYFRNYLTEFDEKEDRILPQNQVILTWISTEWRKNMKGMYNNSISKITLLFVLKTFKKDNNNI